MRKLLVLLFTLSTLVISFNLDVTAQTLNQITIPPAAADTSCQGSIYKATELEKRAVLITHPKAALTDEARAHSVRGKVKLKAVLCRTGQVTDIQVIEGLPFGMTEQAVEAVRKIQFTPAETADGQAVSQELNVDFSFSYIGDRRPLATGKLEGRRIDSILVDGYSQNMQSEARKCFDLLAGQTYNKELIEQVWQRLLKMDNFDPTTSELRIEEGERGGLDIVYLLKKKADN